MVDCGNYRKLERFNNVLCDRPEPAASWNKSISATKWNAADLVFKEMKSQKGKWIVNREPPSDWSINYQIDDNKLSFLLDKTAFKHLGIFPEQAVNWDYIHKHCSNLKLHLPKVRILNLFAYTGAASIVASAAGTEVTHVDSIKQVVSWANKNAEVNHEKNIRWIVEDAQKFVQRAIKRDEKYNGIILDPPSFGHGTKSSSWKLDRDLPGMLMDCMKILDRKNSFFILNTYSSQMDMEKLQKLLKNLKGFPKSYESKILGIDSNAGKFLPLGNLVRFHS